MAQFSTSASRSVIPRQLEITRQFEAQDASAAEIQAMRDRVFSTDIEADLRNVLGKNIERVADIEITWEKWLQFVQRQGMPPDAIDVAAGPLERHELTTRLRLTAGR